MSLEKIYGVHAVEALLRHHPKRVKQVWLAEGRSEPRVQALVELATQNKVAIGQAERREMDVWVEGVHQGVVADVSPSQVWGEAMLDELLDRTEGAPLLLVLDGVTDPHNLGACLRSADAAGALAVIVPKRVKQVWLAEGRSEPRVQALVELANQNKVAIGQAERREMDVWVEGVHQGVVADVSPSQVWGEAMLDELLDRTEGAPLLLVLDGVTDPHNLGACLRSADAAGALAVIVPKDKSATLTPVVRKVACGAAEVIPLVAVTNLARTLEKLQQRGLWVVGTAGEAEVSIYDQDLTGPTILIMGAEGKGMRRLTREHCDYLVHLPMAGSVSSLNVSVATGVCLFEAQRQRGAKAKAKK